MFKSWKNPYNFQAHVLHPSGTRDYKELAFEASGAKMQMQHPVRPGIWRWKGR
jgi:hypothetical protein